jgi:tetrahydromethanopterin S-methyltransferase subunit B
MTYEELLEENKRLKKIVDSQTAILARKCAELILTSEQYITDQLKKNEDKADWWKN